MYYPFLFSSGHSKSRLDFKLDNKVGLPPGSSSGGVLAAPDLHWQGGRPGEATHRHRQGLVPHRGHRQPGGEQHLLVIVLLFQPCDLKYKSQWKTVSDSFFLMIDMMQS